MIEPAVMDVIEREIHDRVEADATVLAEMRDDVRELKRSIARIQPRSATAISLVGTDGGNNQLQFDPFHLQLIRVVDSSNNEHCLEVITQRTPLIELTRRHIDENGQAKSALGRMMRFLDIDDLAKLSTTFGAGPGEDLSPSWMNVYRELSEWAVLYELVSSKDFGTDTVIVYDGFLRSKVFSKGLFGKLRVGLEDAIRRQFERTRRRIYICGIAKRSNVLQSYRIALALEGALRSTYPCFVEIPQCMEQRIYKWDEYFKDTANFVAGKMFLVKFGSGPYDPIWAIDVFLAQQSQAQTVFGYLLEDAKDGFPIPLYPQCLQRAHENAALVDFDMDILSNGLRKALREVIGDKNWVIDELAFQDGDPAAQRYS